MHSDPLSTRPSAAPIDAALPPHLPLPAYRSVTHCPKCGERTDRARSQYCVYRHIGPGPGVLALEPDAGAEHMDRECANCGYGWLERTVDDVDPRDRADAGVTGTVSVVGGRAIRERVLVLRGRGPHGG